ncbi:hypothetical protein J6590_071686 [Homalodisca vitripennis]|nr:hypothetical protein J6590_071686 [Homalodisca vitripennis]
MSQGCRLGCRAIVHLEASAFRAEGESGGHNLFSASEARHTVYNPPIPPGYPAALALYGTNNPQSAFTVLQM